LFNSEEFVKERNEAFLSKDKDKIMEYCEKYDIQVPDNEDDFWAGVHKAICNLFLLEDTPVAIEQYNESYHWLSEHGYTPSITGGEK